MFKGSRAGRRYAVRLMAFMAVYGTVFVTLQPFSGRLVGVPLRITVALVLAFSVLGVIWTIGRYLVEEDDEYLRMRQAQVILLAGGITLSVCTLWGYLEAFGLAPHFPTLDIFVLFSAAWLVTQGARRVLGR